MTRFAVIAGALTRSLFMCGILAVISLVLYQVSALLGSLVMFVGSFWMMLKSYRREWRLHWITCLLPPLASGAGFYAQLSIFDHKSQNRAWSSRLPLSAVFSA